MADGSPVFDVESAEATRRPRFNSVTAEDASASLAAARASVKRSRRKSIDTREAAGFPAGAPDLVKAALAKHFLFVAAGGGARAELDAALAVMVPRRLDAGEALFPAAAAALEGANEESPLQTCYVLSSGSLEAPPGSPEALTHPTPFGPGGSCLNPVALVDPSWPKASNAAGRVSRLVAGPGGAMVWGLGTADFRAAMAESALSKVAARVEVLRATDLLGGAPPELLLSFAEAMSEASFAPGADIMAQGAAGDELFVLTSGLVHVLAPGGGSRAVLASLGPGRCFGEMALLQPGGTRSATVTVPKDAPEAARCLVLGRAHFQALLHFAPSSVVDPATGGSGESAAAAGVEGQASAAALVVAALNRERQLRALEQVPLLASLGRATLEAIVADPPLAGGSGSPRGEQGAASVAATTSGLLRSFQDGEVIATAGARGDTMFVVHRGFVRQERAPASGGGEASPSSPRDAAGGATISVEVLGPGDYFGVDSLLTGEPLAATFVAGAESGVGGLGAAFQAMTVSGGSGGGPSGGGGCEVLALDRGAFDRLLGSSAAVAEVLESHLASMQRRAVLRAVPLLNELTGFRDKELDAVAALLRYQLFRDGDVMVEAGAPARALFIIFDGEADRLEPGPAAGGGKAAGTTKAVRLPCKSHFGDEALGPSEGACYGATVVARSSADPPSVTCLVLDAAAFAGLGGGGDGGQLADLGHRLVEAAAESRRRQAAKQRARRLSSADAQDLASLVAAAAGDADLDSPLGGSPRSGGRASSLTPRALRRLSVGSGMASELPEDLQLSDLEELRVLGEGNYGRVKLVVHRKSGFSLALKTMHKARIVAKRQTANVLREAAILHGVAHPFVLRCVCTFQTQAQVMVLLELVQAGDLWPYIYRKKVPKFFDALPRSEQFTGFITAHARFYAANLVAALEYIHSLGIAYRDLKPENLVFDTLGYLKVIDFGLAKHIPFVPGQAHAVGSHKAAGGASASGGAATLPPAPPPRPPRRKSIVEVLGFASSKAAGAAGSAPLGQQAKSFTVCGTTEYLSPEAVSGKGHDRSIDHWALGCLLYELFAGRTPFRAKNSEQTLANIVDSKRHLAAHPFLTHGPPAAVSLITSLLDPNPATRLGNGAKGWAAVTGHPFFSQPCDAAALAEVAAWGKGGDGGCAGPVDWDALVARAVDAPFTPALAGAVDMSGFEDEQAPDPNEGPEEIPPYGGDPNAFEGFGSEFARDSAFSTIPQHVSAQLAALE